VCATSEFTLLPAATMEALMLPPASHYRVYATSIPSFCFNEVRRSSAFSIHGDALRSRATMLR